jgi:GNAT superfamily N-acetyltransferase
LRVGPLEPADRARWAALWEAYLAFYGTERPPAQYELMWQRLHDATMHGLVARDAGGAVIGIAHFLFHTHGWLVGPACYLQDLFVAPEARGSGAGFALIEAVAAAARAANAERLYWLTQEINVTARRLYDRVARNSGFLVYQYPLG